MKTKELEKQKYLKQMSVAFPKKDSLGFIERVIQISKDLNSDVYVAALSRELRPSRGSINKATIFYLWLLLCIERPWESGWEYFLNEKGWEKFWTKACKIVDKLPENSVDYIDILTIKKHRKRENFDRIVSWAAIDPKIFNKVVRPLAKKVFKVNEVMKLLARSLKKIGDRRTELVIKFNKLVKAEKYIRKRDLMRKLSINSAMCDSLLKQAENRNFATAKKFSQNSTWIIYTGAMLK